MTKKYDCVVFDDTEADANYHDSDAASELNQRLQVVLQAVSCCLPPCSEAWRPTAKRRC